MPRSTIPTPNPHTNPHTNPNPNPNPIPNPGPNPNLNPNPGDEIDYAEQRGLNLNDLTHATLLLLERRGGAGAAAVIKQHVPTYEAEHAGRTLSLSLTLSLTLTLTPTPTPTLILILTRIPILTLPSPNQAEHVGRPATSFFSPRAPDEQILHRGFR